MNPVSPRAERKTCDGLPASASRAMSACVAAGIVLATFVLGGCAGGPSGESPADYEARRAEAVRLAQAGVAAQSKSDHARAIEFYTRSLSMMPDLPGVRTNLAVSLMKQGDAGQAVQLLQAETELSPTDPRPLINLGWIYLERQWADEATEYFARALEMSPNDPTALRGYCECAARRDLTDERTLAIVRRAVMVEKDPQRLEQMQWLRLRVEAKTREDKQDQEIGPADATDMTMPRRRY